MLAPLATSDTDRVAPVLLRVRSVIASYSGGDPKRHVLRLIRAVAEDARTESLATTAVAASVGPDSTSRHAGLADREIVLRALDRALDAHSA